MTEETAGLQATKAALWWAIKTNSEQQKIIDKVRKLCHEPFNEGWAEYGIQPPSAWAAGYITAMLAVLNVIDPDEPWEPPDTFVYEALGYPCMIPDCGCNGRCAPMTKRREEQYEN